MSYLKKGSQYTPLIASSSCKGSKLGTGNTFFTVEQMQEWVKKYHYQVSALAKKLKATSERESVNNIHRFLKDHIAYKADGALQIIKSPACAWKTRKEGTDCKTFSVFASCLLTEMGYNHFIRQVKQPYLHPDKYTHVYITVPIDQTSTTSKSYYVLDGTVDNNKEVLFSEAKDVFMAGLSHVGLAGAQKRNYKRSYQRGLGSPAMAMSGLQEFLNLLIGSGVSQNTVNAILNKVQLSVNQGLDPFFKITSQGVQVDAQFFPYVSVGRSQNTLRDPLIYVNSQLGIQQGRSQQSTQSGNEGETIAQIASQVLESGFFENTFGSIFQNGFDLSCWNSSFSESEALKSMEIIAPQLLQRSGLLQNINQANLNKFLKDVSNIHFYYNWKTQKKFASCTRKGGALGVKLLEAFLDKTITALSNSVGSISKLPNTTQKGHVVPLSNYVDIFHNYTVPLFNYKIVGNGAPVQSGGVTLNDVINQIPKPTTTQFPTTTQSPQSYGNASGGGQVYSAGMGSSTPSLKEGLLKGLIGVGVIFGISKLYQSAQKKTS